MLALRACGKRRENKKLASQAPGISVEGGASAGFRSVEMCLTESTWSSKHNCTRRSWLPWYCFDPFTMQSRAKREGLSSSQLAARASDSTHRCCASQNPRGVRQSLQRTLCKRPAIMLRSSMLNATPAMFPFAGGIHGGTTSHTRTSLFFIPFSRGMPSAVKAATAASWSSACTYSTTIET